MVLYRFLLNIQNVLWFQRPKRGKKSANDFISSYWDSNVVERTPSLIFFGHFIIYVPLFPLSCRAVRKIFNVYSIQDFILMQRKMHYFFETIRIITVLSISHLAEVANQWNFCPLCVLSTMANPIKIPRLRHSWTLVQLFFCTCTEKIAWCEQCE